MTRERRSWHRGVHILSQTLILVKILQSAPSGVARSASPTSSMVFYRERLSRQTDAPTYRSSDHPANAINRLGSNVDRRATKLSIDVAPCPGMMLNSCMASWTSSLETSLFVEGVVAKCT